MSRTRAADGGSIRLNHYLAQIGVASRRASDAMISVGRVRIDGRIVRELGTKVTPSRQSVSVDGSPVGTPPRRIVLVMHKPRGFVTTVSDPEGRPTVLDLCKSVARRQRLFPVGRLDVNTTGALLLTNDGVLCYRLTHPRFGIPRVYRVTVGGSVSDAQLRRLDAMAREPVRGIRAARPRAARPAVDVVKRLPRETVLSFTLLEGRNRQVRQMCEAVGLRVNTLKRVSFGPVSVRGLPLGAVRPLERRELLRLDGILEAAARAKEPREGK